MQRIFDSLNPMHSTNINGITITERETPPNLTTLTQTPRIFLNDAVADDWRIRSKIKTRLIAASLALPDHLNFMIYEAFRSRARQYELWTPRYAQIKAEHSDWSDAEVYTETSRWVSPPDAFGSGHQAGAAIDITLATKNREPLDMGGPMQSFAKTTPTNAQVSPTARANRDLLVHTLEAQGLINYPDEWWHFCYGDRLWAEITGRDSAFFAPID